MAICALCESNSCETEEECDYCGLGPLCEDCTFENLCMNCSIAHDTLDNESLEDYTFDDDEGEQ